MAPLKRLSQLVSLLARGEHMKYTALLAGENDRGTEVGTEVKLCKNLPKSYTNFFTLAHVPMTNLRRENSAIAI